jgi:hypothetical protein
LAVAAGEPVAATATPATDATSPLLRAPTRTSFLIIIVIHLLDRVTPACEIAGERAMNCG